MLSSLSAVSRGSSGRDVLLPWRAHPAAFSYGPIHARSGSPRYETRHSLDELWMSPTRALRFLGMLPKPRWPRL